MNVGLRECSGVYAGYMLYSVQCITGPFIHSCRNEWPHNTMAGAIRFPLSRMQSVARHKPDSLVIAVTGPYIADLKTERHQLCGRSTLPPWGLGQQIILHIAIPDSGVTKVGVTRWGNWWCHPSFTSKIDGLFSHRPQKRDDLFPTLSAFPGDRLSSVLVNSPQQIFTLLLGCNPLDGVTRDGPPPLVMPLSPEGCWAEIYPGSWSTVNVQMLVPEPVLKCQNRQCASGFCEGAGQAHYACLGTGPDCIGTESVQTFICYFTGSFALCRWLHTPVKAHQSKHNNSTHTHHWQTLVQYAVKDVPRNASAATVTTQCSMLKATANRYHIP